MLLFCLLLGCCLNGSTSASLQNTALGRGQQLTLECKMEGGSDAVFLGWFYIQVESNLEKPISSPSSDEVSAIYMGREKVTRTNDSRVLTVDRVELSDAGTYGCKTKTNSTVRIERAQVIVLDGNIRIIRQNSSHISCEISYSGSWRPELRLFAVEAKDATDNAGGQPLPVNSSDGKRKLVVLLETRSFGDNHSYSCQLSFANRSLPFERLVTNVPVYEDIAICGSEAVDNGCEGSSGRTTDATPRELSSRLSIAPSSDVVVISLAVVSFFVFALVVVAVVVFVSVRQRRKRRRASKDSKSSSTLTPCPDILDRSEENSSSGFTRRLPEISSEASTYAEILHHESNVDFKGDGNRFVASDGTEYMVMNSVSEGGRPPFRMLLPSAVPSVLYASIDHLQTESPLS